MTAANDENAPTRWSASTQRPDMWVDPDQDPRESDSGEVVPDERSTLIDYLRAYRLTMEMKCADLDAEQLARRSVPPSTMSLLGLVRHMAEVERFWFRTVMGGADAGRIYPRDDDNDADWNGATADPDAVAQAWAAWRDEVAFADQVVEQTPDLAATGTMPRGATPQLREILVHMIEEYARHCGHADLLRERIDGRVGQ
jgi:uncharacterized damage-inducible protein DinB